MLPDIPDLNVRNEAQIRMERLIIKEKLANKNVVIQEAKNQGTRLRWEHKEARVKLNKIYLRTSGRKCEANIRLAKAKDEVDQEDNEEDGIAHTQTTQG